MKASRFACGLLAASLAVGSAGVFARDRDGDGRDDGRRGDWQQRDRNGERHWQGGSRQYTAPAVTYNQQRHVQRNYSYSQPAYTYSQPAYTYNTRAWRRGDRLPGDWRNRYYTVNNWHAYNGMYAPPAGYGWVQADTGDYLLVALATGLIANLLINR
jgi:Ni/Co efflux regulator RcnB